MNNKSTLSQSPCAVASNGGGTAPSTQPEYRVEKREEGISLQVTLPGVPKDHLQVSAEKGHLTITAERSNAHPEDWTAHRDPGPSASYKLVVRLHPDLDPATIQANLALGVLTLFIDRHEAAKPRSIEVK